jgi:hypothetical protein
MTRVAVRDHKWMGRLKFSNYPLRDCSNRTATEVNLTSTLITSPSSFFSHVLPVEKFILFCTVCVMIMVHRLFFF